MRKQICRTFRLVSFFLYLLPNNTIYYIHCIICAGIDLGYITLACCEYWGNLPELAHIYTLTISDCTLWGASSLHLNNEKEKKMKTILDTCQANPALVPYYQYGFGTFEWSLTRPLSSRINSIMYSYYSDRIYKVFYIWWCGQRSIFHNWEFGCDAHHEHLGGWKAFLELKSTIRIYYILVLLELARKDLYDIGCCGENIRMSVVEHAHLENVNILWMISFFWFWNEFR